MHILITGGAGFIGSAFVRLALSKGCRITVLDALTYAGHRDNLVGLEGPWELIVGNITDSDLVTRLIQQSKADAIISFAAETHVDRSITGPATFVETNVVGTQVLLSSALRHWESLPKDEQKSFRFLQVSTDEVYGSLSSGGLFSENSPLEPNSPYSASKAAGDLLVRAWNHTYGLPTLVTRCSNNYGPRQFPEKLIPTLITCALEGKSLPLYGDGMHVRDWIHVDDHCEGIWLALTLGKPKSTYCFGGLCELPNLELVHKVCSALDELSPRTDGKKHASAIERVTDRPGHDRRYAIDFSYAHKELGFSPRRAFDAGLKETVKWYIENRAWTEAVRRKH